MNESDENLDSEFPSFEFIEGGEGFELSDGDANALAKSFLDGIRELGSGGSDIEYDRMLQKNKEAFIEESKSPTTVLVKSDDRIVGSLSFEEVKSSYMGKEYPITFKGKKLLDISALTILPEYRSKGGFRQLIEVLADKIQRDYPDSIVVMTTINPKVKKFAESVGMEKMPVDKYNLLTGKGSNSTRDQRKFKSEGWEVYVLDPELAKYDESFMNKADRRIGDEIGFLERSVRFGIGGLLEKTKSSMKSFFGR